MKKILTSLLIAAVLIAGLGTFSAKAGAYETTFTTSITYQNISGEVANAVAIQFYDSPSDTVPTIVNRPALAVNGATSIYIGSVGTIPSGFKGTAVLTSDKALAATLVQVPAGSTVKARPLSNGFDNGQATATNLIATFYKEAAVKSLLSVQNADSADTTVTLKFYAVGSGTPTYQTTQLLKPNTGFYVDGGTASFITGATFNGSVKIETTGGAGKIVSSVMELGSGADIGAKAFEGVGQGFIKVYMPSALCTTGGPSTYYAVQNAGTKNTNVVVTYSGGYSQNASIAPGNKASFATCSATPTPPGNYNGSAVIESFEANPGDGAQPIIAIGKVSGGGLATAFNGLANGATKIALPYVRYADNSQWFSLGYQRTYIAIQNLGAAIPNGSNIVVSYYNPDGTLAGTHTITGGLAQYAKTNSNATNAGLATFGFAGGGSGGSVVIAGPAGSQLAVVARVITYNGALQAGEDYNGIVMP